MDLLFDSASSYSYASILMQSKMLIEREDKENNAAHAINNRIHNNAFCALLYEGAEYTKISNEKGSFICISLNNNTYEVPESAVKNILRGDFERIIGCEKTGIDSDSMNKIANDSDVSDHHVEKDKNDDSEKTDEKLSFDNESVRTGIIVDNLIDKTSVSHRILEINEDGSINETSRIESDERFKTKERYDKKLSDFTPFANGIENKIEVEDDNKYDLIPKPVFKRKNLINDDKSGKKDVNNDLNLKTDDYHKNNVQEKSAIFRNAIFHPKSDINSNDASANHQKNLFSFVPKRPILNKEKEDVVPEKIVVPKLELYDDETIEDHSNDRGHLFNHVVTVKLKRRFGAVELGPYRFIIWPTWIYEKTSGNSFAEILVHVTDPQDNEYVFVTQKHENEVNVSVDGKTFKVYGTWKSGVFTSHVSLTEKSASVYETIIDVKKNAPTEYANSFLDQFRLEHKGQPSLFIVPFKQHNGGEKYVPITGYVELNGVKSPLSRMPHNELRYAYSGVERIVHGFWKEGIFNFTSEDENRIAVVGSD